MRLLSAACRRDLPAPDASWNVILGYLDRYATDIDGYAYGDRHGGYQRFLEEAEQQSGEPVTSGQICAGFWR